MIYLDHHATTPLDPRVLKVFTLHLKMTFGNPASADHRIGKKALDLVESARHQVASLIAAQSEEIIFTSGATESNNLALRGVFDLYHEKGKHIITQVTEHASVLETCRLLEKQGARVTYLPVLASGKIDLEVFRKSITPETILISIMHGNNEIGTLQPIEAIGKIAKNQGIFFHVDAAQTAGKIPVDVKKFGIDLLSFSAHKIYGPKGIGALFVRKENPRVRISPQIWGGGQERGFRAGTLNAPAIIAFGEACAIAKKEMKKDADRVRKLRDQLYQKLCRELGDISLNGDLSDRLWNNLNVSFPGVISGELLKRTQEKLALSTGSACASSNSELSYVLQALKLSPDQIHSSLRIGLGRFTTAKEIDLAAAILIRETKFLRKKSPFYSRKSF